MSKNNFFIVGSARLLHSLLFIILMFGAAQSFAQVTAASGTAGINVLNNVTNNAFTINWNVSTTTDRFSAQAVTVGVTPGLVLAGPITPAGQIATESFMISAAQVQAWLDAGFSSVIIRRNFTNTGSAPRGGINADVHFNLVDNHRVTAARGTSTVTTLAANKINNIVINWQSQSTADRFSSQAVVANVNPQVQLAGAITPPSANFSEVLTISGAQVKAWLDAGINVIVIRRNFTTSAGGPAGGVNADVRFTLNASGLRATREQSFFEVQRMQLSFSNQTSLIVVEPGDQPVAYLDVNYSGSGVLEGYWQIAEPGSTEGVPLYRTLSIVKQTLSAVQHERVQSPPLPALRPGKYLLRFCLIDRSATPGGGNALGCPDEKRVVEAAYQVLAKAQQEIAAISISPASAKLNGATVLGWTPVPAAVVYQLQIFQKTGDTTTFVTGMLLPQSPLQTRFSNLVAEKLMPGRAYQWRLNALNTQGQVIGQSPFNDFIYSDDD